jgi:hypothetical protein
LRVVLGYIVKNHIWLPLESSPVLSPFDYEHVVLADHVLQPEITPSGINGDPVFVKSPNCERGLYINKNRMECNAEAGFSHPVHGVAVVKGVRGQRVVTGSEALDCEKVVYSSRPGAFIVACFDGSHTHVVASNYAGLKLYREAYRKKPNSVHVGFNSYSVVFEDYKSIVIYGDSQTEIGIPLVAVAYTGSAFYGVSGKWLVKMAGDGSYEPLVLLGENHVFSGVSNGLPVFKANGRLYRLEGGALVELDFVKAPVERASVYDIVVVDNGRLLRAYDPSGKIFLELPKEPEVNCYATRYGVLCCRSGLCGLVEPGVSTINIEAYNNEGHELRVVSDIPVMLSYGDKQHYCRPGEPFVIREEKASVLKRLVFEAGVTHLLSSESVTVASPQAKVSVEAYGRVYESTGLHECGGLSLVELMIKRVEKPGRVKLEALGREVSEGLSTICTDRNPSILLVEAVDTVSGDRVRVVDLKLERVFIPGPKYTVNVEHGGESSTIELIVEDGELVEAVLKCRNGEAPLKPGLNTVKECTLPAEIYVTLRKQGFIHSYKKSIAMPNLLDKLLNAMEPGLHEVRVGGFKLRYAATPYPDIVPVTGIRAVIGNNVELIFRSKVAGRVAVVSQTGVKWYQVRPGLNSVLAPGFNDTYHLVFDTGYSKHIYRVEIPITIQLQVAEAQAKNLLRELKTRGLRL